MNRPITLKEFAKYLDTCSLEQLKAIALKLDPNLFPKRYRLVNEKISVLRSGSQSNIIRKPSKKEKTKKIKVQYIIGGLLAVFIGAAKGSAFNTPDVGWLLLFGGLFIIIYYAFLKIDIEKIEKTKPKYCICPNCGEIYTGGINAQKCNACGIKLEPLEGFLDRHPDFLNHLRRNDT